MIKKFLMKRASPKKNFGFFDNRQKYLLFVSTIAKKKLFQKKWAELGALTITPAIRIFGWDG